MTELDTPTDNLGFLEIPLEALRDAVHAKAATDPTSTDRILELLARCTSQINRVGTTTEWSHQPSSFYTERDAEWLRLYEEGVTPAEIADRFAVSRQRVSQVLTRLDVRPIERRALAIKERQQARAIAERQRRRATCKTCGATFYRGRRQTTCSDTCAEIARIGRRYFDPEIYERERQASAKTVLRNPTKYAAKFVRHAEAVVSGTAPPPNRRFYKRNSKIARLLREAGLDEVLPRPATPSARFRCAAVNRDGSPCSRSVHTDGAKCHIHEGRAGAQGIRMNSSANELDVTMRLLIARGAAFTADTLTDAGTRAVDPDHQVNGAQAAIGGLFQQYQRKGWIVFTGTVVRSTAPHRRGGMIKVWQPTADGIQAAERDA